MGALIEVILPVFLVLGAGYAAVWRRLFPEAGVDGLLAFTQNFAIPCLLFRAISQLDLGQFHPALLGAYYVAAIACFAIGLLAARVLFGRPWEDSVAIGFCCLFSNSLLLGLPITERAYGTDALGGNYAIIALHSPICYGIGIVAMEVVRARGTSGWTLFRAVLRGMLSNALILGIALGFAVNVTGIVLPAVLLDAVDLMVRAALPAALFALGGVLVRYRPEGDLRTIVFVVSVSLVLQPALTWTLAGGLGLSVSDQRSAVVTSAMPPGVSVYVFANMYGVARRVAASAVLIGTGAAVLTAWAWLAVLP